jgi:hypothetical protein
MSLSKLGQGDPTPDPAKEDEFSDWWERLMELLGTFVSGRGS